MFYFYPQKAQTESAGGEKRHPLPPSRPHDPTTLNWRGRVDGPALIFGKKLPLHFVPALRPTATPSRATAGSWKFPFADQSKGCTISGPLARPQEGQPAPGGVGNFKGAPEGRARVPVAWEAGREGPLRLLSPPCAWVPAPAPPPRPGEAPATAAELGGAQTDGVTGTSCWLGLHRDPQRIC